MMFEKARDFNLSSQKAVGEPVADQRLARPGGQRGGDALRAVEWGELTARLNAARDLRLLLRTESQTAIDAIAASLGDAAASYFALLDDSEQGANRENLGQSKALAARVGRSDAQGSERAERSNSDAPRGDARDRK